MFIAPLKRFYLVIERFKIRSGAAGIPLSTPDTKYSIFQLLPFYNAREPFHLNEFFYRLVTIL